MPLFRFAWAVTVAEPAPAGVPLPPGTYFGVVFLGDAEADFCTQAGYGAVAPAPAKPEE